MQGFLLLSKVKAEVLVSVVCPLFRFLKFDFEGRRSTRLQLQMTIRNGYAGVKWTAFGQGEVNNLNWSSQTPIRNHIHISSQSGLLSKLVEKSC